MLSSFGHLYFLIYTMIYTNSVYTPKENFSGSVKQWRPYLKATSVGEECSSKTRLLTVNMRSNH